MSHEFHSFYYDQMGDEPVTDDFVVPVGTELTEKLLQELIDEHKDKHLPRLQYLAAAYKTHYEIFGRDKKPDYKPDNRLAADMAYDITETFEGYFIGIPVDIKIDGESGDAQKAEYLKTYYRRNHQEDTDAELSKMASKFGYSYEMFYQDDEGKPRSVAVSPLTSFMVYDDSVLKRPLFFVRYSYDEEGRIVGSYSDSQYIIKFDDKSGAMEFVDIDEHYFHAVPAVCFMQNIEKRGLYEGVLNLIEAYNRVLSEKANDVEYFSDAYMVIEGMELPDDFKKDLKEYKLINLYNNNGEVPTKAYFMPKPDADGEQENLINRLEMLIFKMAMVPDITDESFSTASGTALKMRLMPMSNLARNKERKFVYGIQERLKLLANYPDKPFTGDDWERVEIVMHRNMPEDLASEADVASRLSGIVSEETQLSVLSCVDDAKSEIERKNAEKEARVQVVTDGLPTNRTEKKREPTMYEITSILNQRKRGQLTRNNAIEMMKRIGVDEDDAIRYLNDKDEGE